MNIIKKYVKNEIDGGSINNLGDVLIGNLFSGYNPPEDLKYLSHEWNVTTSFNRFYLVYLTFGSEFMTKLLTTPVF